MEFPEVRIPDLTVAIPALNEARNLELLLPSLAAVINELGITFEIIVIDGGSRDGTAETAKAFGARVVSQQERGYGGALLTGFSAAQAPWILTMDADLSHRPDFLRALWGAKADADLVIASRYVPGGASQTFVARRLLSRILNNVYARVLSIPLKDMSSGFRLYRKEILLQIPLASRDFDSLLEVITRLYISGCRVAEVPFVFASRGSGRSHVHLLRFGWAYLRTLRRLFVLRYSMKLQSIMLHR